MAPHSTYALDEALIDCWCCSSCILPSWSLTGHWLYLF